MIRVIDEPLVLDRIEFKECLAFRPYNLIFLLPAMLECEVRVLLADLVVDLRQQMFGIHSASSGDVESYWPEGVAVFLQLCRCGLELDSEVAIGFLKTCRVRFEFRVGWIVSVPSPVAYLPVAHNPLTLLTSCSCFAPIIGVVNANSISSAGVILGPRR